MKNFDLKDVKYMHYLDYKLNNTTKYMEQYPGDDYPRLVEFLVEQKNKQHPLANEQFRQEEKRLYKVLWKEGLFHSCQA